MQLGKESRRSSEELVQALRARKRVVGGENAASAGRRTAGLAEHVDFSQQASMDVEDGRLRRLVVRLPGGRTIVVDAKTPLDAYLRAVEASDAEPGPGLEATRQQLRTHVAQLANKAIGSSSPTHQLRVMFVPGEAFLSAACLEDPELLDVR